MVDLDRIETRKLPLSYGTQRCRLALNDSRYTEGVVALRNDPKLNRYIHHDPLTAEMHDRWLSAQLERWDSLNFAILVDGDFVGTVALYAITPETAEYGRLVIKEGQARAFAPVAVLLFLSFGFEIVGLPEIHCRILEGNERTVRFHDRMGWKRDPRYDGEVDFHGEKTRFVGFSISAEEWPGVFEAHRDLLIRQLL